MTLTFSYSVLVSENET